MVRLRMFAFLCAIMIIFAGCGADDGRGEVIRYDIANAVSNLDPQFASDTTARMIISNLFEGLYHHAPTGEVTPALAQTHTVSQDGLVHTLTLREGAKWANGEPVTAADFVFAFERLFDPSSPSPFAGDFINLRGARERLQGEAVLPEFGVEAVDASTLRIHLNRPDKLLPELLSSTAAMPCNRAFFESTRARYGLAPRSSKEKNLLVNGPFRLSIWSDTLIALRRNPEYLPEPIAGGVNLSIPSNFTDDTASSSSTIFAQPQVLRDPLARFLNGDSDACRVDYDNLPAILEQGGSYVSFEDTVWVLVLNSRLDYLASADIRRAIAHTVDRSQFHGYLPGNLRPTAVLIPPAVSAMGQSFRSYAGEDSPITHDAALAKQLFTQGLEQLELSRLPLKEILVCEENSQPLLTGFIQGGLQKQLSLSTGMVTLPKEKLLLRVWSGDYEAAILPISAAYSSPEAIFTHFGTSTSQRLPLPSSEALEALLASCATLDADAQYAAYQQAEQMVLEDCTAIPLYFETTYYAMAKGVSDVEFSPFLSGVYFQNARKR